MITSLLTTKKQKQRQEKAKRFTQITEQMATAIDITKKLSIGPKPLDKVQLQFIATSNGLEIRHYTEFLGTIPTSKIVNMVRAEGSQTLFKIVDIFNNRWTGLPVDKGLHGVYHTKQELDALTKYYDTLDSDWAKHCQPSEYADKLNSQDLLKYLDALRVNSPRKIVIHTLEVPGVFVLAPTELFVDKTASLPMDPIVVELTTENKYNVLTFWNLPESSAVHFAKAENN